MALDFLRRGDCKFFGPVLPEPYVGFELEKALAKHNLLPETAGLAGEPIREAWEVFRRKLRDVSPNSGPIAITNRILEPLVSRLGYSRIEPADTVLTREGDEAGGSLMLTEAGAKLRCWAEDFEADLDAPTQRGYAYRFSPVRVAQRVLLASGERVGLITNGVELRILLCDPARPESHIEIDLTVWRRSRELPDGYELLIALASPAGVAALPEIIEDARLKQNKVTIKLRDQARNAIQEFVQAVLDHPDNTVSLSEHADKSALAKTLWHEGLVVVYRLLFILKCESTSDPSRLFRFASMPIWRDTYSPSMALAKVVRRVLDESATSGRYLEGGLRTLFKLFADGLDHPGLTIRPLGGALFGNESTPLLSALHWGELSVAHLLNRLLWSETRRGRERVHYGPLDVEDLGRVYEALLELEPGIAAEPMCRLRRQKLEVVVPLAQGDRYRSTPSRNAVSLEQGELEDDADDAADQPEEEAPPRGRRTKVEWIEEIPPGRFYLRVGLGRKSSGSYYTPHSFVRFLVQETLGPQCDERSPRDNPDPGAILKLKVLDPACGSGHFLVEACRFLAGRVYEAARLCDELATKEEHEAEAEKTNGRRQAHLDRATELRDRLKSLPDQEDELLSFLPSRSAGAEKAVISTFSSARAEGICRRLVAVHCIYGVDLNPLAVELAKLSLWIESHAEGLPLTFLDHRIALGNSLTGSFWTKLQHAPGSGQPVRDLFRQNLDTKLRDRLAGALSLVRRLEESVGTDVADIRRKSELKQELDTRLLPFRVLAAAWCGGVMLGIKQPDGQSRCDDDAYSDLLKQISETGELPAAIEDENLRAMVGKGLGLPPLCEGEVNWPAIFNHARPALSYDLAFPEVFFPTGVPHDRSGFDAVVGNPPWDRMLPADKEFFASYQFDILDAPTKHERESIQDALLADSEVSAKYDEYIGGFRADENILDVLYSYQIAIVNGEKTIGKQDAFRAFMERNAQILGPSSVTGVVVPSAFHANEGATGIRRLYLEKMSLKCCYSFENRNKLFEIHSSFKFAMIVAQKGNVTEEFACAFYLHDDQWLFGDRRNRPALEYTLEFVRKTGGEYLSLLELQSEKDTEVARACFDNGEAFGKVCARMHIELGRELNVTDDAWRFTPTADVLPDGEDPRDPTISRSLIDRHLVFLHEGKTFWQFNDRWGERPKYCVELAKLIDRAAALRAATYFRGAYRDIASATNERTLVYCLLCPGCVIGDTAKAPERRPDNRATSGILRIIAAANSYVVDLLVRLRAASHVSLFILWATPFPRDSGAAILLAHSALRLTCNHAGYEPLWREQLSDAWREPGKTPFTWPVLADDDQQWAVRAAIDAVVADAYRLSREQYEHVLSTFSHASYRKAPALCLAAFDELKAIGLEAFCKKHDPYHDIPLVETLPKPVIDLQIPEESETSRPGRRSRGAAREDATPSLYEDGEPAPRRSRATRTAPDAAKVAAVKGLLDLRQTLTPADVRRQLGYPVREATAILKYMASQALAELNGDPGGKTYRPLNR